MRILMGTFAVGWGHLRLTPACCPHAQPENVMFDESYNVKARALSLPPRCFVCVRACVHLVADVLTLRALFCR